MYSEIAFNSIFISSSVSHFRRPYAGTESICFICGGPALHHDRGVEIRMAALNFLMRMFGAAQADSIVLKPQICSYSHSLYLALQR
jgi:hypothetical protein